MPDLRDEFHALAGQRCWEGALPRTALVVAHPGHELRLHGILELIQPVVFVLTDGSGQARTSRLGSTLKLLESTKAQPGSFCGRFTDRALYHALLTARWDLFAGLGEELSTQLVRARIELVACDAIEGFCSVHETAHLLAQAAVRSAQLIQRKPIQLFAFPVVGRPLTQPDLRPDQDLWFSHDTASLQRKVAAALAYQEIAHEVQETLATFGVEPFRCEGLRRIDAHAALAIPPEDPPFYERHARDLVCAGAYPEVITYQHHILPLAQALLGRRSERRAA